MSGRSIPQFQSVSKSEGSNQRVDLFVAESKLTLHVRSADKLWVFEGSWEIPLVHIAGRRADPEVAPRLVARV